MTLLNRINFFRGYKTYVEVGPLPPGDCYQFRLKVNSEDTGESEWSDILTATTKGSSYKIFQKIRHFNPIIIYR